MGGCDHISHLIMDHLAGELGDEETSELYRHIEDCSRCAAELDSRRVLLDQLSRHQCEVPPLETDLVGPIHSRIRAGKLDSRPHSFVQAIRTAVNFFDSFPERTRTAGFSFAAGCVAVLFVISLQTPGSQAPSFAGSSSQLEMVWRDTFDSIRNLEVLTAAAGQLEAQDELRRLKLNFEGLVATSGRQPEKLWPDHSQLSDAENKLYAGEFEPAQSIFRDVGRNGTRKVDRVYALQMAALIAEDQLQDSAQALEIDGELIDLDPGEETMARAIVHMARVLESEGEEDRAAAMRKIVIDDYPSTWASLYATYELFDYVRPAATLASIREFFPSDLLMSLTGD